MAVESQLEGLSKCCERMGAALEARQASTAGLLDATEGLQAELATNSRRATLVSDFLEKYQLAPGEVACLREGEVATEAFYTALARVADIHDNCRQLLRRHHQRAGLELMDAMALYQESAYERLCRWVQAQCRALGEADLPELPPQLARAMAALRARPGLRRHAAEEAAAARGQALFGRFIAALTRGGPGGVPRPMESHAHDPRRYVGDMCAWLHQACAGERELMHALMDEPLPTQHATAGIPAATTVDDAAGVVDAGAALNRVLEGVCRPFKLRVEAALSGLGPSSLVLSFQLTQLLGFYASTLGALVGETSVLTSTMRECAAAAAALQHAQLAARVDRLARFPPAPESHSAPGAAFSEAATRCGELLTAAQAVVGGGASTDDIGPVLEALLMPLLDAAVAGAHSLVRQPELPPWAGAAYICNCIAVLRQPLAGRLPGAEAVDQRLAAAAERQKDDIAAGEARRVLTACQMLPFQELASAAPVPGSPALAPAAAGPALEALYTRIASASPLPEFRELAAKDRSDVTRRIAALLAEAYAAVYNAVREAHPGSQLRYSAAQVKTVCDGL